MAVAPIARKKRKEFKELETGITKIDHKNKYLI
jgi:hypothetical protein